MPQQLKATYAVKQVKATHAKKMKWRMIPAMKSSLKATHAIKGNSKEVSQPGERPPEHKEGWRQEPRSCSETKARTAQKHASMYALSGHERIEKRSEQ